jgi:RNA polymerase sigma-70 factor (family 1)
LLIRPLHNEKNVIQSLSLGSESAFLLIFDTYYQALGNYIYKITESREATEDIVQDTFIKVWEKREMLVDVDNFSSYLFILCKHKAITHLRKLAKEKSNQLSWSMVYKEESYSIDALSFTEEYNLIIEQAVTKLPPQQQKVYQLGREKNLKYEEIASLMGVSKETVKKHMHLALTFLKKDVKEQINHLTVYILLFRFLS